MISDLGARQSTFCFNRAALSRGAGAFSGLAMDLNALATAVLLPVIWRLMF